MIDCLLCGASRTKVRDSRRSEDLVKLWNHLGRPVSSDDLARCGCEKGIDLLRCDDCGFEFFDPSTAGDGLFYQRLAIEDGVYYNDFRPEFQAAVEHAKGKGFATILDIGCGGGSFLDMARESGLQTFGMELNEAAATSAAQKGHEIHPGILTEAFLDEHTIKYDMVTLFQVVEHLPDPVGLLRLAKLLVKDGGTLMISVPNSRGLYQFYPLDPHQWPPHHMSRWRISDFDQLAERIGMRLFKTGGDMLHGASIVDFHARNREAKRELGRGSIPGGGLLVSLLGLFYRATRMKHVARNVGLSIHCFFEYRSETVKD